MNGEQKELMRKFEDAVKLSMISDQGSSLCKLVYENLNDYRHLPSFKEFEDIAVGMKDMTGIKSTQWITNMARRAFRKLLTAIKYEDEFQAYIKTLKEKVGT